MGLILDRFVLFVLTFPAVFSGSSPLFPIFFLLTNGSRAGSGVGGGFRPGVTPPWHCLFQKCLVRVATIPLMKPQIWRNVGFIRIFNYFFGFK